MPIEKWFPLAVYYADLEGADKQNVELKKAILQLMDESKVQTENPNAAAWTGDVHGVGQIHSDPRFAWLVNQVEMHCLEYLEALGHDLSKIALYIQRAWPVVSKKGEFVATHAHHNANVSAVYYVDIPGGADPSTAGVFVLHNKHSQNEVQAGIATISTKAISEWNELNIKTARYLPLPGRLLMFPAKQPHSVDVNETEGMRISVSFDIVMTASKLASKDTLEFLSPPPDRWKAFADND
jgi:5-oxoprolinase (ATP-hydrolysing) subunit B